MSKWTGKSTPFFSLSDSSLSSFITLATNSQLRLVSCLQIMFKVLSELSAYHNSIGSSHLETKWAAALAALISASSQLEWCTFSRTEEEENVRKQEKLWKSKPEDITGGQGWSTARVICAYDLMPLDCAQLGAPSAGGNSTNFKTYWAKQCETNRFKFIC